jgi:glycosyltransferase involved in cell wall biosynthesis
VRIGVVTTSYPRDSTDPAGIFVAGLARWLAGEGARVEVVAAGPGASRDGDIVVHRIAAPQLFYGAGAPEALASSWRARAAAPAFVARLAAAVARRARRWDAMLSHWLVPCGLVGAMLARRHVAIAHSGDIHLLERLPGAALIARMLARTRLVFVSDDLRERFARLCGRPVGEVIPMGADGVALAPPDGPPHVLFMGRLVPIKGADVLVAAARRLPDVRFTIAGAGPEENRLRAAAPANVCFAGVLAGQAKRNAFAAAHLVCVPSTTLADGRTEGSPVIVAEALACGRPVVASATGGIPQLVGDAGLLVQPRNPAELASAIHNVLTDYESYAGKARARGSSLTWQSVGPRIAKLLHS